MSRPRLVFWKSLLLTLPVWTACQSTKSEENTDRPAKETAAPETALTEGEVLAQRFSPFLRGAWVQADYLAAVRQTKSPLQAARALGAVSEIHLDPSTRRADSLVAPLGLANHEGGALTLYFRPGRQASSLPTSFRSYEVPSGRTELGYAVQAADTALLLTTYGPRQKPTAPVRFERVRGARVGQLGALSYAVSQLLFVGRYAGTDSLGRPAKFQFTADGRLKGLKGFKSYQVVTDFADGPGNDIDHLLLDPTTTHRKRLAYRLSADTLRLYAANLRVDGELPELVRGRLLFTLRRR